MSLYKWDIKLYTLVSHYLPKCWLKGRKGRKLLPQMSDKELKICIENSDIYPAGIQILLNMGVLEFKNFGEGCGMYYHPIEDGKHVRAYKFGPTGGQMDYYYPFKRRALMFR